MGEKFRISDCLTHYTIVLQNNRIHRLCVGGVDYYFRDFFGENQINEESLKKVFEIMMIKEPKKFKKLYNILQKNDPEMFEFIMEVQTSAMTKKE